MNLMILYRGKCHILGGLCFGVLWLFLQTNANSTVCRDALEFPKVYSLWEFGAEIPALAAVASLSFYFASSLKTFTTKLSFKSLSDSLVLKKFNLAGQSSALAKL